MNHIQDYNRRTRKQRVPTYVTVSIAILAGALVTIAGLYLVACFQL